MSFKAHILLEKNKGKNIVFTLNNKYTELNIDKIELYKNLLFIPKVYLTKTTYKCVCSIKDMTTYDTNDIELIDGKQGDETYFIPSIKIIMVDNYIYILTIYDFEDENVYCYKVHSFNYNNPKNIIISTQMSTLEFGFITKEIFTISPDILCTKGKIYQLNKHLNNIKKPPLSNKNKHFVIKKDNDIITIYKDEKVIASYEFDVYIKHCIVSNSENSIVALYENSETYKIYHYHNN